MDEQAWDEFAQEYYLNQLESQTTIVNDVIAYLKKEGILPAQQIVDVAGGAGRYLALAKEAETYELIDFSNEMLKFAKAEAIKLKRQNVCFSKQSFSDFLREKKTYELVFSAANPALDSIEKLEQMLKKMNRACVVIRIIDSTDDLFLPLEEQLGIDEIDPTILPDLMNQFEQYLAQKKYSYQLKDFTYFIKEEISRSLMESYYEEYQEEQRFIDYLNQKFQTIEPVTSTTQLTYRLLLIETRKRK